MVASSSHQSALVHFGHRLCAILQYMGGGTRFRDNDHPDRRIAQARAICEGVTPCLRARLADEISIAVHFRRIGHVNPSSRSAYIARIFSSRRAATRPFPASEQKPAVRHANHTTVAVPGFLPCPEPGCHPKRQFTPSAGCPHVPQFRLLPRAHSLASCAAKALRKAAEP